MSLSIFSSVTCEAEVEVDEVELDIKQHYNRLIEREKSISKSSSEYWHPVKRLKLGGAAIPHTFDELRHESEFVKDSKNYECQIAKYPFAMGGVRAAYHGRYRERGGEFKPVIFKEFLRSRDCTMGYYLAQSTISAYSCFLVHSFCRTHGTNQVEVIPSRIADVEGTLWNIEDCLTGTWTRWSVNSGVIINRNELLVSLSLWTHSATRG
jgi:hypothetical protein